MTTTLRPSRKVVLMVLIIAGLLVIGVVILALLPPIRNAYSSIVSCDPYSVIEPTDSPCRPVSVYDIQTKAAATEKALTPTAPGQ